MKIEIKKVKQEVAYPGDLIITKANNIYLVAKGHDIDGSNVYQLLNLKDNKILDKCFTNLSELMRSFVDQIDRIVPGSKITLVEDYNG